LVLPFARLQGSLNVNLGALFQVLFGNPAQVFIENHDAMPFGLLASLASGFVAPRIRRREPQIGDRPAILSATDFRIGAQVADQNDLVHASRHRPTPFAAR
jgi:hypothetical protein